MPIKGGGSELYCPLWASGSEPFMGKWQLSTAFYGQMAALLPIKLTGSSYASLTGSSYASLTGSSYAFYGQVAVRAFYGQMAVSSYASLTGSELVSLLWGSGSSTADKGS
jgi:hypothetical protein